MALFLTIFISVCLSIAALCGGLWLVGTLHGDGFGRRLLKIRYALCLDEYFTSAQPLEEPVERLEQGVVDRELLGWTIDELCSMFAYGHAVRVAEIEARYGLNDYFTECALRRRGAARVRCLRTLSRFTPNKRNMARLALLRGNCSEADLQLLILRISAAPRRTSSTIEAYHRILTRGQVLRLTEEVVVRRTGLDWRRCLNSENVNLRRVGFVLVSTAGIVEAEELLCRSLEHPDGAIAAEALCTLAEMKLLTTDSRTAAALGRMSCSERKTVYRKIVRSGYSEHVLEPLIGNEELLQEPLGDYLRAAATSYKHSLR